MCASGDRGGAARLQGDGAGAEPVARRLLATGGAALRSTRPRVLPPRRHLEGESQGRPPPNLTGRNRSVVRRKGFAWGSVVCEGE